MDTCMVIQVDRAGKVGEACLSFVSKLVSRVITLIKFCCLGTGLRLSCVFEELFRCVVSMGLRPQDIEVASLREFTSVRDRGLCGCAPPSTHCYGSETLPARPQEGLYRACA